MSKQDWQQPVFLDPQKLQDQDSLQAGMKAQEFDAQQVVAVTEQEDSEPAQPKRKSRWKKVFTVAITTLLGATVASELYRFISWGYDVHYLLGIGCSTLVGVTLLSGVFWVSKSLRGLRQLAKTEALHQQAIELMDSPQQGQAAALFKQLDKRYEDTPLNQPFKDCIRQLDSAYNDAEMIRFVSEHGLTEQDAAARRCVRQYSVQSGLLVALSPYATFDMLLVGWRNLRMLREIADIYGIAPGAATQWRLLGQVLQNIAFSGLSELVIDAGSQALGTSLTGQLSSRAAQGIGAGMFTARTGIQAIRLCRPLPLSGDARKAINQMRQSIIEDVGRQASGDKGQES